MPRFHDQPSGNTSEVSPLSLPDLRLDGTAALDWDGVITDSSLTSTVFVLVHGAWHGFAQWAPTRRALAGLGAASVPVDLPGHGVDAPLPSGYLLPCPPDTCCPGNPAC